MIVLDTSGVLAALDSKEDRHRAARETLESDRGPFVLSPFVLAELDYLLGARSYEAEVKLLQDVETGAFRLETMSSDDVVTATTIVERYRDLGIGLADASVVVLADRAHTRRILTLDERHFRAMRPLGGGVFTVLPADRP